MFRSIARLFFGGEEETREEVEDQESCADVVEEGWLVVTHREAESAGKQENEEQTSGADHEEPNTSVSEPVPTVPLSISSSSISISSELLSGPKVLAQLMWPPCAQKTKVWTERPSASRGGTKRQNLVRRAAPRRFFPLQQPGNRTLGH